MKYLYLQFLRLRVWILRRRLRAMGFRDAADRANAETILRLQADLSHEPTRHFRWFEIIFMILGIFVWLIFDLRPSDHDGKAIRPKATSSPAFSEVAPSRREFGQVTTERTTP